MQNIKLQTTKWAMFNLPLAINTNTFFQFQATQDTKGKKTLKP
jgi:hypothetical protein